MQVVGSTGTTHRTIVEHGQVGVSLQQLPHRTYMLGYALWLMLCRGYGEMYGQDGERIQQQLKAMPLLLFPALLRGGGGACHLHLRPILLTEETRPLVKGLLVNLRTSRHHSCRIELQPQADAIGLQLARLHLVQVLIALARLVPDGELSLHEMVGGPHLCSLVLHPLPRQYLHRAQPVFI